MLKTIIARAGKVSARSLCQRYFQIFSPLFVFAQELFINFQVCCENSKKRRCSSIFKLKTALCVDFLRSYHHRPEISHKLRSVWLIYITFNFNHGYLKIIFDTLSELEYRIWRNSSQPASPKRSWSRTRQLSRESSPINAINTILDFSDRSTPRQKNQCFVLSISFVTDEVFFSVSLFRLTKKEYL